MWLPKAPITCEEAGVEASPSAPPRTSKSAGSQRRRARGLRTEAEACPAAKRERRGGEQAEARPRAAAGPRAAPGAGRARPRPRPARPGRRRRPARRPSAGRRSARSPPAPPSQPEYSGKARKTPAANSAEPDQVELALLEHRHAPQPTPATGAAVAVSRGGRLASQASRPGGAWCGVLDAGMGGRPRTCFDAPACRPAFIWRSPGSVPSRAYEG